MATDAGVDAPAADASPFPADPQGGEFAWVVSADGAGAPLSVAVDSMGNIMVVANQTGDFTLDGVRVPRPSSADAVLVLKLTPNGKALWAHSFDGNPRFNPRSVATTPSGDVVVGATFQGNAPVPFPPLGQDDGFIAVLDGRTGDVRWSSELASSWDDSVAGVAVGVDATGDDAIYVYGQLGNATVIAGQDVPAGAALLRYDLDGTLRWAQSFPNASSRFNQTLAADAARGPVITGNFWGDLVLGDEVLSSGGSFVAGFDPDGHVRFARQLRTSSPSLFHGVAAAASGDVYVASETSSTETVVDDHILASPDFIGHPFVIRLTAAGRYAFSSLITGNRSESPQALTTDRDGAAYMLITCSGRVDVQPEVDCGSATTDDRGGVIVSYGTDNEVRWSTYVKPAFLESLAPAPGGRMIVAGQALAGSVDFGGVRVATKGLFIAALATGPARLPSPLPAAPVIADAALDGVSDGQIRQGGTGTLVIHGTGLDKVTLARLGDIDIHVPPGVGTPSELRLAVMIPHGHAPGPLGLKVGSAGGASVQSGVVAVTPIVVTASGSTAGRGTFASPLRLCGASWNEIARYGDLVQLQNGVHACNGSIFLRSGVTVRGQSKTGAIVTGVSGANSTFGGFGASSDGISTIAIENMTIKSANLAAVHLFSGGKVTVTDVDIQDASGSGVWLEEGATATLTRYRYLRSSGTAIVLFGGRVDATGVDAEGAFRGVLMTDGTLSLKDSFLSSSQPAIQAGDTNQQVGNRDVTVVNTTLRSNNRGIFAGVARLTITGSTIEPAPGDPGLDGISLYGGSVTMKNTTIRGWTATAIFTSPHFGSPVFSSLAFDRLHEGRVGRVGGVGLSSALEDVVSLDLDHVEITSCPGGIHYEAGFRDGQLTLHNSHVHTTHLAVGLSGDIIAADLGTAASPGNNQLQSDDGEAALWDGRTDAGAAIDAHGTTLNGVNYSGDILGPAESPGYKIAGPNTIRF